MNCFLFMDKNNAATMRRARGLHVHKSFIWDIRHLCKVCNMLMMRIPKIKKMLFYFVLSSSCITFAKNKVSVK